MTSSPDQFVIDSALGSLSRWDDAPTGLWREALNAARPVTRERFSVRPSGLIGAIAACLVLAVAVALLLPSMGKARASARMGSSPVASTPAYKSVTESAPAKLRASESEMGFASVNGGRALQSGAAAAPDRLVVRKAAIDLRSRDVRAVFAKVAQVPSEAGGEFVEESSLTGDDDQLQASLTLRVSATRLSSVLNQIRGLADVTSETSGGEDVTDQFVDLEARLRNEQRVETELLELLTSRKDAPLKDVLDLRDSLSRVRESVERMTAQKERLSRLVSLATVLVIIRPDSTKPPPIPEGLGGYFLKQVQAAWQGSLTFLADSVALLVRVVVGGAVFWMVGVLAIVISVALRRRAKQRLGREPAPMV